MRIGTCNVNGIRAAIKKGMVDWLVTMDIDIFCMQEVKALNDQIDEQIFQDMGYELHWHSAQKKGYSGVMTMSRLPILNVEQGIQIPKYDQEGRVLRIDVDGCSIYNCYFPSGSSGEERHQVKMDFIRDFGNWMDDQIKADPKPKIVVGDYNIVHLDNDIHNPQRKDKPSGYRPEERKWLSEWFQGDFKDAYRAIYPDETQYSWWSFRAGSRQRNKGWRIDYMSVTNDVMDKVKDVKHYKDVLISDHCPIVLDIDL